jgi:Recombinase zinc beta ribbon domain
VSVASSSSIPYDAATLVRQGYGLLSGLRRCGRCGRTLHGRYWGKSGTAARYVCRGDFSTGGQYCLGLGGASIDKQISDQGLETIRPLTLEASLQAAQAYEAAQRETTQALRLQIQQVEYEAARAFEQYDHAAPKNRVGTSPRESRWKAK